MPPVFPYYEYYKTNNMSVKRFIAAGFLLCFAMMTSSLICSAQGFSVKVGDEEEEKKEKVKEKPAEEAKPEKPAPSLEHELKRIFGVKSETSLSGPRVESIGKFFLDKYTGEVTMVSFYRSEPVRWRILRDNVPDDIVYDIGQVNYQLIRYGNGENDVVLLNVNTGAMWGLDFKGISLNYKHTRFKYIPKVDTVW